MDDASEREMILDIIQVVNYSNVGIFLSYGVTELRSYDGEWLLLKLMVKNKKVLFLYEIFKNLGLINEIFYYK